MKTTFAERLQIFINYLETNPRQLEIECELGNGTLSKVLSKGTELGVNTINKIKARHPELNTNWLMNGEGEMLIKSNTPIKTALTNKIDQASEDLHNKLIEENEALKKDKERLMKWIDKLLEDKK